MTDIVERLRSGSICSDIHDTGSCCRVMEAKSGCECAEAADEITRLRAASGELLRYAEQSGCADPDFLRRMRAALEDRT